MRFLAITALVAAPLTAAAQAQTPMTQVSPSAYSISGWRVECSSRANALACQLVDQVTARANNGVLAGIAITQTGDAKAPTIVVQVPLGAALDAPVRLGFNAGAEQTIAYVSCYNNGCFARGTIDDTMLAQMRDAKQPLALSYSNYDNNMNKQTIRITLPLDGFAVAYGKLK
ncbi:MAG TPA: invasion associated locus B family protein [Candidatus Baltobacteraceae bacterium]|nr:invasion associated locus B family protein [Candidatus Baltobacteraceae bacterium]